MTSLIGPANFKFFGFLPGFFLSILIPVIGIGIFIYIMARRLAPLVRAAPNHKIDRVFERIINLFKLWLGQKNSRDIKLRELSI